MAEDSGHHCPKDDISPMARELLARADHAIQSFHLRRASNQCHAAEDLHQQVPANCTCDCGVPLSHGEMPCWSTYRSAWRDDLRKLEAFHRVPGSGDAMSNLFDQANICPDRPLSQVQMADKPADDKELQGTAVCTSSLSRSSDARLALTY